MSPTYQRHSPRLPEFDYTQPGAYFITCVTWNRAGLFGEINSLIMTLSNLGSLVQREWERLVVRFRFLELDEYVVMPNHIHGIIIVHEIEKQKDGKSVPGSPNPQPKIERFGSPVAGSIPTIIRSFKSSVTQQAEFQLGRLDDPIWQPGFYEHVIRKNEDWERIRAYIQVNPQNWENDEENRTTRGAL